jgi:hypothetical protein
MKPLTQKAKEDMLELSKENDKLKYFTMDGVLWKLIGTKCNDNGSYSNTIKNRVGDIKQIGSTELNKIRNNK